MMRRVLTDRPWDDACTRAAEKVHAKTNLITLSQSDFSECIGSGGLTKALKAQTQKLINRLRLQRVGCFASLVFDSVVNLVLMFFIALLRRSLLEENSSALPAVAKSEAVIRKTAENSPAPP